MCMCLQVCASVCGRIFKKSKGSKEHTCVCAFIALCGCVCIAGGSHLIGSDRVGA